MGAASTPGWRSGIDAPRVGLLSIGEEETQGQRADARRAPAAQGLDAATSSATSRRATCTPATPTSIVCDGFTGNVALKISEGLVEAVERPAARGAVRHVRATRSARCWRAARFRRFRKRLDYSEYGGAPLLGVAGLCLVGHGRSSARAVRNARAPWRYAVRRRPGVTERLGRRDSPSR